MKNAQTNWLLAIRLIKGSPGRKILKDERALLEKRMHKYLDPRCVVTIKGNTIHVGIQGRFTKSELHHKASGAVRVYEWEAA